MSVCTATRPPCRAHHPPTAVGSPFGHRHDAGPCYATWLAHRKAWRLVGRLGFSAADRDDLEQHLLLKLLERWPRYNPQRGTPQRFITWSLHRCVVDIVRQQLRQRGRKPHSLDDASVALPPVADPTPAVALRLDVAEVLAKLPPSLRAIAESLQTHSVAEISRELGLSRQAVRRAMGRIRAAFEREGFGRL